MLDNARVNYLARLCLGLIFIYHGLVPKIILLSPVEVMLVEAHGIAIPAAILSPIAGIVEVVLGFTIILWRKSLLPVFLAGILLMLLLVDVAIFAPTLLFGAFNPVTTNLPALFLCYLIVITQMPGAHTAPASE